MTIQLRDVFIPGETVRVLNTRLKKPKWERAEVFKSSTTYDSYGEYRHNYEVVLERTGKTRFHKIKLKVGEKEIKPIRGRKPKMVQDQEYFKEIFGITDTEKSSNGLVQCPKCSRANSEQMNFCYHCKTELHTTLKKAIK